MSSAVAVLRPPPPCVLLPYASAVTSLTNAVWSHANSSNLAAAFSAFSDLRRHLPSSSSALLHRPLSALIFCSTSIRSLSAALQLHSFLFSLNFLRHPPLLSSLSSLYVSLDLLPSAQALVYDSKTLEILPFNILISAYLRRGMPSEAISTYNYLTARSVNPDNFTYTSILSACGKNRELELGKIVHRSIEIGGLVNDLFVVNALMGMYVKFGQFDVARKLFNEMPERDVVSWNTMISGYASVGMWNQAFEIFEKMKLDQVAVNSVTWNTILGGKLQMGHYVEVLSLISEMRKSGLSFDFVTFVIGLNTCSRIGFLRLGKEFHGLVICLCYDKIETITNALITLYSRCKDTGSAYILFQMAETRNVITWNSMLAGFATEDQAEEASMVFRDMVFSGVEPNYVTVVTILSLCARVANLQHGRELHCYILKRDFSGYRLLWNALVDVYSKSGRIFVSQRVFDSMSDHDGISYTSLITGYGIQGEGYTALKLFEEMITKGIKPDHISMVAVLSACGHCGLVSHGEELFNKMVDLYKIKPQVEHYSCMVILFARAGLLSRAEEMLNNSPFPTTPAMWAALLGACEVRGNIEIGERAARKLLELKTQNAGHYVLIANKYAAAGFWEEVAKVRMVMRDIGVKKSPGCSWADLGNGFHPFMVDDRSSAISDEIYILLDSLTEQMRDAGYIEELGLMEEAMVDMSKVHLKKSPS